MAGNPLQKLKLLYLLDIFKEYTDEEHPLSAEKLCEMLEEKGVKCERKSIYGDIGVLMDYGCDIVCSRTEPRGYFLAYRDFQVPEICLLSDAVESADFISTKKSRELVKKLETLIGKNEAKKLHRQVFIDKRNKCENEKIFITIDALSSAIDKQNKVRINYVRHIFSGNKTVPEQKTFEVSPYALAWVEDHYYLVCNNSHHDNLMHLRVDRISSVKLLDELSRPFKEVSEYKTAFDVGDYIGRSFNMFGGEKKTVDFRCENRLLEQMIDRFGENMIYHPDGNDHFVFRADVMVSEGLVGRILQYGGALEVTAPADLRKAISEKAKKLMTVYGK